MRYQYTNANHAVFARHDDEPHSSHLAKKKQYQMSDLGGIAWIHLY
jgi:hypothetical protein